MASLKPKYCCCYVILIDSVLYNKIVLGYKFIFYMWEGSQ